MPDPFRDELTAAHAKIAELEKEVRSLKETYGLPSTPEEQRKRTIGVVVLCAIAILIAVYFMWTHDETKTSAAPSTAFSGIAIAPTSQASEKAPSAAPKLDKQNPNAGDKKPCNCTPGDPLCSCL